MAIEIRETDGLENSGLTVKQIWALRIKREKQRGRDNAVVFTAKLKASKVQQ